MRTKRKPYDERTPVDWNLDYEFICWLNRWFREYKKNASSIVDLEYRKYEYSGKLMTQLEVIDRVIELTTYCRKNWFEVDRTLPEKVDEIFDLFKLVFWSMWW